MAEEPKRKVGYKSPPQEHQFQPGQPSANPKGRPRKNKAYQQAVLEQLNRKLTITVNGRRRKVSVTDVALQQLCNMAAAGDFKAIQEVNKLHQKIAPLRPQPEMSPEEIKFRQEAARKLTDLIHESLERKAAEKKPERPRLSPKPPEEGGGSDDESN